MPASLALLLVLLVTAPALAAEPSPSGPGDVEVRDAVQWPHPLPFMADVALKRGYELPLPFGVSGVFFYVERDVEISNVRLGINGAPLRDVNNFIDLGARSRSSGGIARFDAWLLPFLDVYGLVGYVTSTADLKGTVTVPRPLRPGSLTFNLAGTAKVDGPTVGGGFTLVGGYRELFVLGDLNYSKSDLGFEDKFDALIGTVRVGWNGKVLDTPLQLWAGATYWRTQTTAKSTVDVPDVGRVTFEARQGPVHPLNAVVGTSFTLGRRWNPFVEYGFNGSDVQTVSAGLAFRF